MGPAPKTKTDHSIEAGYSTTTPVGNGRKLNTPSDPTVAPIKSIGIE